MLPSSKAYLWESGSLAKRKSAKAAANRGARSIARTANVTANERPDNLIPTQKIRQLMGGINLVTLWRWRRSPKLGCPPLTEINGRLYGSEREWLAWRENLQRRALGKEAEARHV